MQDHRNLGPARKLASLINYLIIGASDFSAPHDLDSERHTRLGAPSRAFRRDVLVSTSEAIEVAILSVRRS